MSEWQSSDISLDSSADVESDGIELLDDSTFSDVPDISDSVSNEGMTDTASDIPELLDNSDESLMDNFNDDIEYVPELVNDTAEEENMDDASIPELTESISDQPEENLEEAIEEIPDGILDDETKETEEPIDEDAPKVLKRDESEAWSIGNAAIENNVEAMRDDLRDKGWPDGSEMENLVAIERGKMEEEFGRNLAGDFSNPYLGPNFQEYTGDLPGLINDQSEVAQDITTPVEEPSAYDRLYDYYSSHNYGRQDYSKYSQDTEWQRLNNDYLASLGRDPIDYSAK